MGSIVLPGSGTVYLDANAIIYSVETNPSYWPIVEPVWQAARAGQFQLVSTELTLLEVLVVPLRNADSVLVAAYEKVLTAPEFTLLPITTAVLREAARLRAAIGSLRTPDAIHAATALVHPPTQFITNDLGFQKVPGLPVTVLSDLLTP